MNLFAWQIPAFFPDITFSMRKYILLLMLIALAAFAFGLIWLGKKMLIKMDILLIASLIWYLLPIFFGNISYFIEWVTSLTCMICILSSAIVALISAPLAIILGTFSKTDDSPIKRIMPVFQLFLLLVNGVLSSFAAILNLTLFRIGAGVMAASGLFIKLIRPEIRFIKPSNIRKDVSKWHVLLAFVSSLICFIYLPSKDYPEQPQGFHTLYRASLKSNHKIYGLALDADDRKLFFSDGKEKVIGKIDLTTREVTKSAPIFVETEFLFLDAKNKELFTALKHGNRPQQVVGVNAGTLEVKRSWSNGIPSNFLLDEKSNRLVFPDEYGGRLNLLDLNTSQMRSYSIPTFFSVLMPTTLCCGYVISGWYTSWTLTKILLNEEGNLKKIDTMIVGPFSLMSDKGSKTGLSYLARPLIGIVDVLDVEKMKRLRRIQAKPMIRAVAVDEEHGLLFWSQFLSGEITAVQLNSGIPCFSWHSGPETRTMIWSADLDTLFYADRKSVYAAPGKQIRDRCGMKE